MALSDEKRRDYARRLLLSRNRVLCNHGFYGLLLMHASFLLDEDCDTAYTDGDRVAFSPAFMDKLSDSELDFILMHEILHVALEHCHRNEGYDRELFNIACDIVVNSNILKSNGMRAETITLAAFGESMHLTPKKQEGYLYTAEEVYAMFPKQKPDKEGGKTEIPVRGIAGGSSWDDHSKWEIVGEGGETREVWMRRVADAAAIASGTDPDHPNDGLPPCIERILRELRRPRIDWRTMLNDFVQEEICDYSFSPPDRRFSESVFFLPDFNDTEVKVENVLFMVDTSASITDEMIRVAYSEIKGAIDQFEGKLSGMLGFFDTSVYGPYAFDGITDVTAIRPKGGGGTSFYSVFEAVQGMEQIPASIVILTDGYAHFPAESMAQDIPVLWLINNEDIAPPWGTVARMQV